ncbi:outer membrane protein assembly factor [Azospirillum humicireducens]|uniref:Outer membrane protein assembly factor n=1 Tax=Azospirillum humicireducens TaxID=1226968 RepID=A0A168Y358_9PROT|nr:BamA/TamA family outer membrane protein [Azospirillum humicireducens]ANC91217.2 outer membrane protein assembly factor [Azospirillum humicireducens]
MAAATRIAAAPFKAPIAAPLVAALLLLGPSGSGRAQNSPVDGVPGAQPGSDAPAEEPAEEEVRPSGVRYDVEITGVEDDGLRGTLNDASTLVELKGDAPPSLIGLERRADSDRDRLQTALRSAGYYDARLDIRIEDPAATGTLPAGGEAPPVKVTVAVTPGPLYHIKTVTVRGTNGTTLPGELATEELGLAAGMPAVAQGVLDAETALVGRLAKRGYAFAKASDREVVVDHSDRTMDVAYTLNPGPLTRYGATRIEGLEKVDEDLVRGRLAWTEGQVYDPGATDRARQDIAALQVFDTVRVRMADEPGPDGVTPVIVTVGERKRRFIGGGLTFSTEDGLGTNAYWGHRNLFGGAEQLRVGVDVGRVAGSSGGSSSTGNDLPDLRFSVNFRKPDFLAVKQSLVVNFAVVNDQPPAYSRVASELTVKLERPLTEQLTVSYGVTSERGRVRTKDTTYQTAFIGVPLGAAWNGTDNLLNPTSGQRASLQVTPWFPVGGDTKSPFTSVRLNGSTYYDLGNDGRYVAAARVGLGSILGTSLTDIPPDHRFFAGGGGSVRGYGFQKAGPRDRYDDPVGGRSLFEIGAELRIKVTESIGVVPFVDAGTVYDSAYPDFSEPLRVGAGVGLRYYTDFGPLRVDVGVPLNPASGDARWQLYLSLGQAF